ncbi:MAG: arginase family protein, partial [Minisyncoccales bacterium]
IDLDNSDLESSSKKIYNSSMEVLRASDENEKIIFLGGDHSISYHTTRAFFDYCQSFDSGKIKEPCLIVFDAHPDLMSVTSGAEKYPNHEEWLRQLIKDGFPVENILLVGVRNSDPQESAFIKEKGLKTMPIDGFFEDIQGGGDMIMEFSQGKELYVSLDIDVVDPAFAPGTGYTEAGGFSSREFLYLVKRINKIKNLKALDIVEINPEKDEKYDYRTLKLGARVLSELV